jgi:hypothetical protein
LDEKCTFRDNRLHLENQNNTEDYSVIIVPSCKTISISNLKKIVDFYKMGGTVIFTTQLPSKSAEPAKDSEVTKLVNSIFTSGEADDGTIYSNLKSGKACYLSCPDGRKLRDVLRKCIDNWDVDYPMISDLQYIHKVLDGRNIYYFANLGGSQVSTTISLRGKFNLEEWDPHTGSIRRAIAETESGNTADMSSTRIKIALMPYHSFFLIEIPEDR